MKKIMAMVMVAGVMVVGMGTAGAWHKIKFNDRFYIPVFKVEAPRWEVFLELVDEDEINEICEVEIPKEFLVE